MENKLVTNNVETVPVGISEDKNAPYSFLQWRAKRRFSDEREEARQYSRYILEWFKNNREKINLNSLLLRQKYILLLEQLQLFFTDEERNNWYSKLNLLDDKELLLSIPFFAKKLRDISLYYLKLRRKVKQSKQKYNRIGTADNIENEIRSLVLELFSEKTNGDIYALNADLSKLRNDLVVRVEELYDDKVYFDQSNTLPVSSYHDLYDAPTAALFATKGIILSSDQWLFNTFNLTVTSDIDKTVQDFTKNYFEQTDVELYKNFLQTFLGEDKFKTQTTTISTKEIFYDLEISEGNNKFFYPYGSTQHVSVLKEIVEPVALSSLNIEGATAGVTLEGADTIFVRYGNQIKSAWYHFKQFENSKKTLNGVLEKNATTDFIFPYPGYGISNSDTEWTGPDFETSQEYKFLTKEFKTKTDQFYWDGDYSLDSCDTILINNTTLVVDGATPSRNPNLADQIFIRPSGSNRQDILNQNIDGAWLFQFDRTSIPVLNEKNNVIVWPYAQVNPEENVEAAYRNLNYEDICDEISIQNLEVPYAVAGNNITNADVIYKLQKYDDGTENAIECAWLSGRETITEDTKYIESHTFNALIAAGEFTKFVWNGPDTPINKVFKTIAHDEDCPFSLGTASIANPEKCSCKQIYYTPFGHAGKDFLKNNSFADCVIQDTGTAPSDFDFGSWRSNEGKTINENFPIYEFAWYQTNKQTGWGDGRWVTGPIPNNADFILKRGKKYFYRRVNSRLFNVTYPPYVVFYKHDFSGSKPVWIEAKVNEGVWNSTGNISKMKIYPGDILKYSKQTNTFFEFLSSIEVPNTIQSTGKNAWIFTDIVPVSTKVNVFFPEFIKDFDKIDPQYPSFTMSSISAVLYWDIQLLDNENYPEPDRVRTNKPNFSFTPTVTGVYKISMTNAMKDGRQLTLDIIPTLSVLPTNRKDSLSTQIITPRSSFVIEQPLTGWSYNRRRKFPTRPGAKPYWAVLHTGKDLSNKFKGAFSWGYENLFVEEYLPINIPKISPLEILYQNVISYKRRGEAFSWKQPINFKKGVYTNQWCELTNTISNSSNIAEFFSTKNKPELVVIASEKPSDIVLSNDVEGNALEIQYYALNSFVWSITANVNIIDEKKTNSTAFLIAKDVVENRTNRFFPTIANIPTLEKTFTEAKVGGYFTPQNLGASVLLNKDFIPSQKDSTLQLNEDTSVHIGGLGLSKQKQPTNYTWSENNEWVMEPSVAGKLAGTPKKKLTKTLQTFIPYQANSDETPLGLITPKSRYSPWGGKNKEEWTDKLNEPKSFTGVRNVSAWVDSQILKQNEAPLECWTNDIYGNQYGLFKYSEDLTLSEKRENTGELWIRTNEQKVLRAAVGLSAVFEPYSGTSVYTDLTGNGIKYVDCFFDTLMIETSGAIIFAEVIYNYNTSTIDCIYDNTRTLFLTSGTFRYENNWFFTNEKVIVSLMTTITAGVPIPQLWKVELGTRKSSFVFPTSSEKQSIFSTLSGLSATNFSRGLIDYNDVNRKYFITYNGIDFNNKPVIVSFYVKQTENECVLQEIQIYKDTISFQPITEPPAIIPQYLSAVAVSANTPFTITVSALNDPTYYSLVNYTSSISVTNSGTFIGAVSAGVHHVNYVVGNNLGETYYSLTLLAS